MLVQFGMGHRAARDDTFVVSEHDAAFMKWNTQVSEGQMKVNDLPHCCGNLFPFAFVHLITENPNSGCQNMNLQQ